MFLRQILHAKFHNNTFTAYKYKDKYLIRKEKLNGIFTVMWNEYDSFPAVLESLKYFELDRGEVGDPLPFLYYLFVDFYLFLFFFLFSLFKFSLFIECGFYINIQRS